jgi:hypothetical protein
MSKNNGGLGVRYLEGMNKTLLFKWTWLWTNTNTDQWWKESIMNTKNIFRPWEINELSTF